MSQILLSIPDESLAALHVPPPQAGDELRMLAAVKLFELKRLSSARQRTWQAFRGRCSCSAWATTACPPST